MEEGNKMTKEYIHNIGELKEKIKDLPDDLPIEVEVHNGSGTYVLEHIYRCVNGVEEPIVSFYVKYDWVLTDRDEKAFEEWCKKEVFNV